MSECLEGRVTRSSLLGERYNECLHPRGSVYANRARQRIRKWGAQDERVRRPFTSTPVCVTYDRNRVQRGAGFSARRADHSARDDDRSIRRGDWLRRVAQVYAHDDLIVHLGETTGRFAELDADIAQPTYRNESRDRARTGVRPSQPRRALPRALTSLIRSRRAASAATTTVSPQPQPIATEAKTIVTAACRTVLLTETIGFSPEAIALVAWSLSLIHI